jgi:hypothetical protein
MNDVPFRDTLGSFISCGFQRSIRGSHNKGKAIAIMQANVPSTLAYDLLRYLDGHKEMAWVVGQFYDYYGKILNVDSAELRETIDWLVDVRWVFRRVKRVPYGDQCIVLTISRIGHDVARGPKKERETEQAQPEKTLKRVGKEFWEKESRPPIQDDKS